MKKIFAMFSVLVMLAVFLTATQSFAAAADDSKKSTDLPPGLVKQTEKADSKDADKPGKQDQNGKKYHFRGIIAAASADALTLTVGEGNSMTFTMSSKVKIKVPTLAKAATAADLKAGMQATVQAEKTDSGYEAIMVMVVPGKTVKVHHVGVVTAYSAGTSLTVKDKNGVEYTFKLTAETKLLPEERADKLVVGARVTVIFSRNLLGGTITAAGVVIHPAGDVDGEGETETEKVEATKTK